MKECGKMVKKRGWTVVNKHEVQWKRVTGLRRVQPGEKCGGKLRCNAWKMERGEGRVE